MEVKNIFFVKLQSTFFTKHIHQHDFDSFYLLFQSKYNTKNVPKLYLCENTAKSKLNVICFHISHAFSSLDLIDPEDTQLGDLKITQPSKLVHLTLIHPDNDSISREKAQGNKVK